MLTLNNRVFSEFEEIANLIDLKGLLPGETGDNSTVESFSILCSETLGNLMVCYEIYYFFLLMSFLEIFFVM